MTTFSQNTRRESSDAVLAESSCDWRKRSQARSKSPKHRAMRMASNCVCLRVPGGPSMPTSAAISSLVLSSVRGSLMALCVVRSNCKLSEAAAEGAPTGASVAPPLSLQRVVGPSGSEL